MLDKSPSTVEGPKAAGEAAGAPGALPAGATSLAVLIVGMHRSGTSALSGVLNHLGVATPEDLHPADRHNERGYFEPARIIDFHERLLGALGSPSDDPLPLEYDWVRSPVGLAAVEELADLLDEEFGRNAMCLFKDPRICRLMPVWSGALARSGRAGVAIVPFRHPLEVAGSLAVKAGLSRAYSLFLWLQHVILGERFTRAMPRSFADYADLMTDWRCVVAKFEQELGLAWPRDLRRAGAAIDAFLTGELRHHSAASQALEPHDPLESLCARTWEGLARLKQDPYDPEAMASFDEIWAEFGVANGVFGPLVVSYQREEARKNALAEELRAEIADLHGRIDDRQRHLQELDRRLSEREQQLLNRDRLVLDRDRRITELEREAEILRKEVMARDLRWAASQEQLAHVEGWARGLEHELHVTAHRLDAIEHSSFWAATHPMRKALERFPVIRRAGRGVAKLGWWTLTLQLPKKLSARRALLASAAAAPEALAAAAPRAVPAPASAPAPQPAPIPAVEPFDMTANRGYAPRTSESQFLRILFVSGESHTPGHTYRVLRWAEAARQAGMTAVVHRIEDIVDHLYEVHSADLVFIWRARWHHPVERLVHAARDAGTPIVFDVDDLMFEPELAEVKYIDGIRSQGFNKDGVRAMFELMRRTLHEADYVTSSTAYLAERMRRLWKPGFVLPNGFDEQVFNRSRLAARRKRANPDGLVRIGYATGSKTHQKDFAQCAGAVARVLRENPAARLVLFKAGEVQVLDIGEFPMFDGLHDQVEWRQMVPVAELPDEVARFDICIAPLEVGNPFCEAKSELKFFEAALADVVTIASPTAPFRDAIRDGETGFLATGEEEWYAALDQLVGDADLRKRVARAALYDSIAKYGPERRVELFQSMVEQVVARGRRAARAFELDIRRQADAPPPPPHIPPHEIVFHHDALGSAEVTVIVPLYNYAHFVLEALDSVAAQTLKTLDLVVVDDASTDDSLEVAKAWIEANHKRFNRTVLIRNTPNAGLGFARNVGFANAETPFVLPLDADNRLLPAMCEIALAKARETGAAYVYPRIRQFGTKIELMGEWRYDPARLVSGNYIDAMALIRKAAWADVGGYDHVRYGWEDYDLWCRFAERGYFGERLVDVLAEYRVHGQSMLHSETDLLRNKQRLIADMERRHPWLHVDRPDGWDEAIAALEADANETPAKKPG